MGRNRKKEGKETDDEEAEGSKRKVERRFRWAGMSRKSVSWPFSFSKWMIEVLKKWAEKKRGGGGQVQQVEQATQPSLTPPSHRPFQATRHPPPYPFLPDLNAVLAMANPGRQKLTGECAWSRQGTKVRFSTLWLGEGLHHAQSRSRCKGKTEES